MDWTKVTVQDCIEMYDKLGKAAVINDGQVVAFIKENRR